MADEDRVARELMLRDAVLRGDGFAWQTVYNESFESLWKYVEWRSGGNRAFAEDIVQETWVVAVRRIREFAPQKAAFTTWLCSIASKQLQAIFRREYRRPSQVSLDCDPASERSANQKADEETSLRIAAALAGLPERFEAVLRAKYLDSMTVDEIAGRWEETPKAIESLLSRARDAFRDAYLRGEEPRVGQESGQKASRPPIRAVV